MKKNSMPPTLVYVDDSSEGYLRVGGKKNFRYVFKNGNEITSQKTKERINSLVIPPDWKKVWICKSP
ncbi:MAG TPA: hypothetical protein VKA10_04595, partial [Prolixibacteraceae bacterium]|nr:hypothetical protein [Prolixibacteraceae bacterium]